MAWANEKAVGVAMQAALAQYARNVLPGVVHPFEYFAVENRVNVGTFDTWIGCNRRSAWVELKIAGPNAAPKMRPGQPGFGYRQICVGHPAVVLVGHKDESYRLIAPDTVGSDWREKLLERGDTLDWRVIERIFNNDWGLGR